MRFTHLHSSSRYDRSPESLQAAALRYSLHADLVTYTEVSSKDRKQAVKDAQPKEFNVVVGEYGPKNDCAIAVRGSKFEILHRENFKASGKTFQLMGHLTPDLFATTAVIRDRQTLCVFVVTVIHLPASVENDLRLKDRSTRTATWFDAFTRAKHQANKLKRDFDADGILFVADYNINFKRLWARTLVKTLAPGYNLTWRKTHVRGGTHGQRIIDGTLLRGQIRVVGSAELHRDDPSSDHRPYIETLAAVA